ncbi:RNA polymerase sigma-70 factor [uncultured Draconibacterium sp.]|uniref:RNA polymerase sigma-70 factor n=1 Tax=uncultured Draconibacterium sp. TaxID=1573823 RepID=UPI0032615BFB
MSELNQNQFLLSELQHGQGNAFDFIFRKYYKRLCIQANLHVKDLDKSQSLVQECFIKLWENRSSASEIKNLSAYLSFMVRNKCIDYLRGHKDFELLDGEMENEKTVNSTEEQLLSKDFEEKLLAALEILPDRSREAFIYSRMEGLTYKEIAEKMKISNKAVEALIARALRILRVELKDYLPLLLLLLQIRK